MHLDELERRYYVLRGRLAAGQLDEGQFAAAQRDLLGADASGRLWTIDRNGQWLRHDGEHWVPDRPPTAVLAVAAARQNLRRVPALPLVAILATLAAGFLILDVVPVLRSAGGVQRSSTAPATDALTPTAVPPRMEFTLTGGEPLIGADLDAAAQLVDHFLAGVETSSDWPGRQALLMEALAPDAAAKPGYYQQFLDLPRQKRFEPNGHRLLARSFISSSIASIIAEATYRTGGGDTAALGWAFAVVRREGRLQLLSVQLNTAV